MYSKEFVRCLSTAIVFLWVLALPSQLVAETPAGEATVSFEELRAYAFSNSPLIASIDERYAEQLGDAVDTGLPQNPELDLEARYPGSYPDDRGDNEYAVSLSQPLRISDFGARRALKELSEKSATQKQKISLLELSQDLFLQYVRLWALRSRQDFVSSMETVANKKARVVSQARDKGFLGTSEVKLFEAGAARLSTILLGLEADIALAEAELVNLSNLDLKNRFPKRPGELSVPSLEEAKRRSKANSLGIRNRIELLERIARKQSFLAMQDSVPGFTPRLLFEHTDERKDFIGVGVSFELPFFNRNQGERIRTSGKENELRARRQYLEGEGFGSHLEGLVTRARASAKQAITYEKKVFPLFKEALTAAEHQFEAGQTSVLQLWQSFGELNSANEEMLELWVQAYAARSELSLILGEEL